MRIYASLVCTDGPDTITVHVKSLKGDSYDIKVRSLP
jgi:hypothetical protein